MDMNLMCRFALIAHTHMNTNMVIHDYLTTNAGVFILKTKPNFLEHKRRYFEECFNHFCL